MPRYIDADKFVKQFERALEHQQKYGLYNHAKITEYVIKAIENEPTADVIPTEEAEKCVRECEDLQDRLDAAIAGQESLQRYLEREGEWEMQIFPLTKCSVCGYVRNYDCEKDKGWKFCPECGAKMK